MARFAQVTKSFAFDAAHQLPGHTGKCAQLHGHTYRLDVTLRGTIREEPGTSDEGFVLDFADLSAVVKEQIICRWDHRFLNDLVPFRTTAENLAWHVFELLERQFPGLVWEIRIWETPTASALVTRADYLAGSQGGVWT